MRGKGNPEALAKWRAEQKTNGLPIVKRVKVYPEEVNDGKVTKKEFKVKDTEGKIYLLGHKSYLMLKKAIQAGLDDNTGLGLLAQDIYNTLESNWTSKEDKKKLQMAYKLLERLNSIAIKELAVKAAISVVDKIVPDKISPRKAEGEKSADELRESVLGLFKKLGVGNPKDPQFNARTTNPADSQTGGCTTVTAIISATRNPGKTETGTPDRFLFASRNTSGQLPQELETPEAPVRGQPDSKDGNDNN